jgi:hypothetical protein
MSANCKRPCGPKDAVDLGERLFLHRGEVQHAIGHDDVERGVVVWNGLRTRDLHVPVRYVGPCESGACLLHHRGGEVDSMHLAACSDEAAGHDEVDACTAPHVQKALTDVHRTKRKRVAYPAEGLEHVIGERSQGRAVISEGLGTDPSRRVSECAFG